MTRHDLHRNANWYEKCLNWFPVQLILGLLFVILPAAFYRWDWGFWENIGDPHITTLAVVISTYITIAITLRRILRYPGEQAAAYILPTILIYAGIAIIILLLLRLPYSSAVLTISFFLAILWFSAGHFIVRNWRTTTLAIVPFGEALELEEKPNYRIISLETPTLPNEYIHGIVADLRADNIGPEWEKFLAQCTLNRIPVYHIKQIKESLTGRVRIDHLSENDFGRLLPSEFYNNLKRSIDVLAVLLSLPVTLPVMLITAWLIKREDHGPALFLQERLGYGGKTFKVYKFRTMYQDQTGKAFTTGEDDPRITPIGKTLRKYRLDELPQFWNVLKGEMSLIGPRPESYQLAEWYEKDVPFFSYRHVVRPGISGWAQVMQGYAAEVDGMKEKLEYDFYYIKHYSLWLDMLIFYKTIRTILTGSGAR
ncbi:MAG: sugar transferase [Gammaproteobacteria bacterium]|nr:sugar transferase [Gammaproteobacteria bacterium]